MLNKFTKMLVILFVLYQISGYCAKEGGALFWPPAPASKRIKFIASIYSPADIGIKLGILGKLKNIIFGKAADILNKPIAVAIDKDKAIYICDAGRAALHIFIPKERRYKRLATINKQELISPVGVAVSEKGLIFVSDSNLKRVFCLDKSGRHKFTLGEDRSLLRPTGLAVSDEKLYVVDTAAHAILVFDLAGNFILKFGQRGKQDGQFNYPASIAIDKEGRLYIVDAMNFRIQVFDRFNKFLYSIGQAGNASGTFSRPKAVAIDTKGHIYAVDGMFDNIQIFGRQKEFLLSVGESGHNDGEFWLPSGIAIDEDDYIYVADAYNQRIQVFQYVGK